MAYWLFKSEPDVFSWDDLVARGDAGEPWDGVRNYQARNNMRAMQVGDHGFFYHSNATRDVVGIVEVIAPAAQDPSTDDPRWECVTLRALAPLKVPFTLDRAKAEPALRDMVLVNNSRLSVQPVSAAEWDFICAATGVEGGQVDRGRP